MSKSTIHLEDITEEDYTVNIEYDFGDEEVDQPLSGSVVASIIFQYLIKTGKINDFYHEAILELQNAQVSNS